MHGGPRSLQRRGIGDHEIAAHLHHRPVPDDFGHSQVRADSLAETLLNIGERLREPLAEAAGDGAHLIEP